MGSSKQYDRDFFDLYDSQFIMGSMCCIVYSLPDLPSLKHVSFGSDYCLSQFGRVGMYGVLFFDGVNNRHWCI